MIMIKIEIKIIFNHVLQASSLLSEINVLEIEIILDILIVETIK